MPTSESSVFTERHCTNLLSNTQGCKTLKIKERDLFTSQFWRVDRKVTCGGGLPAESKRWHKALHGKRQKVMHVCLIYLLC